LWLKSAQWITASFLQAFALRQVLPQERLRRGLHRQRELQEPRLELQQVLALLRQVQEQERQQGLEQVLLLFCRKRSGQQQRPTGRRSTDSCSWCVQKVRSLTIEATEPSRLIRRRDQAKQIGG